MTDLALAVRTLAERRQHEAMAKKELGEIEVEVYKKFGERLAVAKEYLSAARNSMLDAEAAVRAAAIAKPIVCSKPHPAITVGMYTVLAYDESDAIDHCRKHLPNALSLNRRFFETVAKVAKLKFVSITTEPRAKIARDLSRWLPGGEGGDGN